MVTSPQPGIQPKDIDQVLDNKKQQPKLKIQKILQSSIVHLLLKPSGLQEYHLLDWESNCVQIVTLLINLSKRQYNIGIQFTAFNL